MELRDVVVFDIEIARCIPDRGRARDPDLEYCEGWHDHAGMGIAAVGAYDFGERIFRVFLEDNLADFAALIDGRMLAGFNIDGFDCRLLRANGIDFGGTFDLLSELRAACGEPREYTRGVTKAGRKLDDVARANLGGAQKSAHGELAPVWWQQGRRGSVIDYVLRDVWLEARLIRLLPTLTDPLTHRELQIAAPWLGVPAGV